MGIEVENTPSVSPYFFLEDLTSGSIDDGMLNNFSKSSSQLRVWILNNIVLEAFDTSVICNLPRVRFHISQVSIVPNASFPPSASFLASLTLSRIHLTLVAEKYASIISPVFCRIFVLAPSFFSLSQKSAVRLSCHTIALYTGLPVSLFHTTVVSR